MVGSSRAACSKRSAACRIPTYSRSTALIRDCHSWLCGMLPHLHKNLLQCLFRQRHGLGLAHRDHRVGAAERIVMEVPLIAGVVEAGDVIVSRHEVEIDHTVGTWGRSPDRLE